MDWGIMVGEPGSCSWSDICVMMSGCGDVGEDVVGVCGM